MHQIRRPTVLAVLACLLLIAAPAGQAAEGRVVESRIVAVTVFPDRAEVRREAMIDLPAGAAALALADLPASLFHDSLRVRTAGGAGVQIGSVEAREVFAAAEVQAAERALLAEIEALQDNKRLLDDRRAALKLQLEFIRALGREGPKTVNEDLARGRLEPETWKQAWASIGKGAAEALEGIRSADLEQRALERTIQKKQRELAQIRTGRRSSVTATVNLEAAAPGRLRLELSYQLPGAYWRPIYDARLATKEQQVGLTQIGEVRQRTGEDWRGVELTLSTARPSESAQMPDLESWFIDFLQIVPGKAYRSRKAEPGLMSSLEEDGMVARESLADAPAVAAPAPVAQIVAGEFASEYRIAGAVAVPSDNAPHKFVIAEDTLEAELAVRVVPKVVPRGYLFADFTYGGAQPLLPGPVSVFRDEAFIGASRLDLLRPGESRKLSFGVDDKIAVEYRLLEGERSREGLINKDRRQERRYLTKLTNHHERAMAVTLLDQLPVPQDERIEVELLKDSSKPTTRDSEERKGVLAWQQTLQPAQEAQIRFGYAVTYPEDQQLPGF